MEGSLQAFKQWTVLSNSPSRMRGFPFYTSRWGSRFTYFYRDILVRQVGPSSSSVGGSRSVGREWRGYVWSVFLGDGLSSCCPILASRSGFGTRSGLGGRLLSCPSVSVPHVLPLVASDPRTARPLRGVLTQSGSLALSQSLA